MCGVIGYVGRRSAQERLLKGLERLEYRGYDSAGICLFNGHRLEAVRGVGKLDKLRGKNKGDGSAGRTGLRDTRWATHGRVSERNAHPLTAGDGDAVAIVLNGIIENFAELKRELIAGGAQFTSETDAEVVAHLVERSYRGDLAAAGRTIQGRLDGHFAFVAVHRDEPGLLVGTRRRCPLLVGVGDGEAFLASSITAFGGDTRRIVVLEDDEVVTVTADGVRLTDGTGAPIERGVAEVDWDDE